MRGTVEGPWFEDLKVGQTFDDAPAITITSGHTAMYAALFGDRMHLPLDATLSEAVSGRREQIVHPGLVWNIAIGASTIPSQRVRANLFYRGLIMLRPVHVGDTVRTSTEIVALKQNAARPDKPATGLAVLRVRSQNQHGEPVLDFWRCPMIPLRDGSIDTGNRDPLDVFPEDLSDAALAAAAPSWRLDAFRERVNADRAADLVPGTTYEIQAREPVVGAPELVRATLNMAMTHLDPDTGAHGKRLVYGGHTISIAAAQISRALPGIVTILGWRSCDHLAPVFEEDLLRTDVTIDRVTALTDGSMVDLHVVTTAAREGAEEPVLDWRTVVLIA